MMDWKYMKFSHTVFHNVAKIIRDNIIAIAVANLQKRFYPLLPND